MTDEQKYTFSSLMTLLIESERKLGQFYEGMRAGTDQTKLKSLMSDYAKKSLGRMEKMRKTRVETVVEMTLEPITGLNLDELLEEFNSTAESRRLTDFQKAMTLERTISELYARASPKIMQISAETSELLTALSRESADRCNELKQYIRSA